MKNMIFFNTINIFNYFHNLLRSYNFFSLIHFLMSSFYKNQLRTYIGATLADMATGVVMNGLSGQGTKINWGNALLGGLQTGTNFVAYPIAVDILEKNSKAYKELESEFNDPKKSTFMVKSKVYVINALTTSALVTTVNYPLSKVQDMFKNNGKTSAKPTELVNFYVNGVLPNIGYPLVANTLSAKIPESKNSLKKYLRGTCINLVASFGGSVFNLPVSVLRDHVPVTQTVKGFCGSIVPIVCTQDFLTHFQNVFKCISE